MTNLDCVTRAYEALAGGDTAAVIESFDRVARQWEDFRCVPVRFHEAQDCVIVEGRYHARFRPAPRDEDTLFCHIWRLRDGRIVGFQQYVDTAQVREVMGATAPALADSRRLFSEPDGINATWIHRDAREGFESASLLPHGDGHRLIGHTSAFEDGVAWTVGYQIDVDNRWQTVRADVREVVAGRENCRVIESDRAGHWTVDGVDAPLLDGCRDIDLESSALTNTIFLHRVQPSTNDVYDAPAAFVRCAPLRLERIEQTYRRTIDDARPGEFTFEYTSPAFDTNIELRFDHHGLIVDYPGLASRYS